MAPGLPIYVEECDDIRKSKYYQYNEEIDYESIVSCLKETEVCKADILTALGYMKKVKESRFIRTCLALNAVIYIYPSKKAEKYSKSYVHFAINKYNNQLTLLRKKPEIVTKQRKCLLDISPGYCVYSGKKTTVQGISTDIALKFEQNIYGINFNLLVLKKKSKVDIEGRYLSGSGGIGGFFYYQRNILDLNGIFEFNVGLNAGFMLCDYNFDPYNYDLIFEGYGYVENTEYLFGGPLAHLKLGNRRVYVFTDYSLLFGNAVAQLFGFGLTFRF